MATKPIIKTQAAKTKAPKSETSKSETSKTETSKSETSKSETSKTETSKTETSKTETSKSETGESKTKADGDSSTGGKQASASSRSISYFSSVSSDSYRSGWDNIFSSGDKNSKRKPAKVAAKRSSNLPANITLDADDLDPAIREQLETVFRRHAKKKRLNYDKLSKNGQVRWQISCHLSKA